MWRAISIWTAETLAVFRKEWRAELRSRYALNAIGLFACSTLVVVSIALGPAGVAEEARRTVLPVLLWLILLFATTMGIPRTFVHEEEVGTALALRLAARPSSLFCGKLLYNLTLMLALEALVAPLYVVLLQMPLVSPLDFLGVLLIGGYGLTVAGTLIAAMVAQARIHGALFAVLAFPILLPLLLFAVQLTRAAVTGEGAPVALHQAFLYDATLTVAGLMLFPAVWNP